ncbi:hypothetical protein ACWCQS_06115 [Streptomyces sp. NPDC002076]
MTVNGPIVVDSNGGLQFVDSNAHGGITVMPGGELDINHNLHGNVPLGTSGMVNGGIVLNSPSDFDIYSTTVNGGVRESGPASHGSLPTVCGSHINGGLTISNVPSPGVWVGDPEDRPPGSAVTCQGNVIQGGVGFSQVNGGGIEGNTIIGGVTLDASRLEFNGNTIIGQSVCSGGTVIVPGEPPDPASNTCRVS